MYSTRNIQPILNALFVFEVAARELSFTRAAQHLGMAQPSVSRFIANLEDHVGAPLFHRRHSQIEMTAAGDALYKAAELGLGHIRAVIDSLLSEQGADRLSIACTHGFAHMWVLPRIEALRSLLPGWDIRLNTSDQPHGADFNDSDIVIRFGAGDWPDMHTTFLYGEQVFPVCAPGLLQVHDLQGDAVQPGDLAALPLLVQDHGEFGWLSWPDWFKAFGVIRDQLPATHPVPGYHFILQAATEGKGMALAWSHLTEPYLANGWLIELPDMRVKTRNGYYATHALDHPHAAVINQWLEACRGQA